jgi:NAD(P)-dependent dehydrogenase (short-subunit alcohol dehydrogenase family)
VLDNLNAGICRSLEKSKRGERAGLTVLTGGARYMELSGKTALVTGAGSGIGRAIAIRFAKEGARVGVNDVDGRAAEKTVREIEALGGQAYPLQANISKREEVHAMVAKGADRFGAVNILVNNAGTGGSSIITKDMPPDAWENTVSVNLNSAFYCCQAVIPGMIEKGEGKIVNIASLAASRMSKLGGADYTASKYGLVGFSHHLAFELAAHRINVNTICPGATLTPLVVSKTTDAFRETISKQVPFGRWVSPEDIAEAALFLASDRAAMITGIVLDVDGGQLLGIAADYQDDLARRMEFSTANLKKYLASPEMRT